MAKVIVQHVCSECGTTTGRWLGKCPGCGAFGSLVEELSGQATPAQKRGGVARTPAKLADVRSEEASRISSGVPELDRVLGGHDVYHVRGLRGLEQRQEGPHAPDTPEVDGVDDLLGLLGIELEETAPAGEARVVDEEPDRRMALCDLGGDLVHLRAVGDVARLGLRPDLGRHLRELLRSAGDEDAVPAPRGEEASSRGPDSARPSRDDGDPHAFDNKLPAPWLISPASAGSSSEWPTAVRSRGRSPRSSPREGRASPSPTRATASRRTCASWGVGLEPAHHGVRRGSDEGLERAFAEVGEAFGGQLDILVHSVAFADTRDLEGRFTDTPRDRFWLALDVSAYSLVAASRHAEPLMEAAGGGSILTMTYLGGERAVPHYNVMGVAKAALDAPSAISRGTSARRTSA